MAELVALDLAVENASEWIGWAVKVRNALGQYFFTIPVQEIDHVIA
jgi:hypothetical protein